MRSREDDIVRAEKTWMKSIGKSLACPGRTHLGRQWREQPTAVDVRLRREPKGVRAFCFDIDVSFLRRDLYKALRSHLKGVLVGKVLIAPETGAAASKSAYVSIVVPPGIAIDPYRGRECQHVQCRRCGEIRSTNWTDSVAATSLAGRRLWPLEGGGLYIDSGLVEELDLARRFRDLLFLRVKVIPEPLDGDILPGDPGWDGTFRPQKAKLKKRT